MSLFEFDPNFRVFMNIGTILTTLGLVWVVFYIKSDLMVSSIFENLIMNDSPKSNQLFGLLVNLVGLGAILEIIRLNLDEKQSGQNGGDDKEKKSLFRKILYYIFSYFSIFAYITAFMIILFLMGRHPNFWMTGKGTTTVSSEEGDKINEVLNNHDINCDLDLGVVLCKIKYHYEPDKLATCETKCAILALESKYECCGLGKNNQTIKGTVVSDICKEEYGVTARKRREITDYDFEDGINEKGLSNDMYEWQRKFLIDQMKRNQEAQKRASNAELNCTPGEGGDKNCSCDPYLNELGFSTIGLLAGLSVLNIIILIVRNVCESCCGKRKKKNQNKQE